MKRLCKAMLFTTGVAVSLAASAADYQPPNATRAIATGVYLENLSQVYSTDYAVQRLSQRAYWIGIHGYNALALVGDEGVLVVDPLAGGSSKNLLDAIASITDKPVKALVYSHYHLDHVGGARVFVDAVMKTTGVAPDIYAAAATAEQIARFGNKIPPPTVVIWGDDETFAFEGITLRLMTPRHNGHSVDNSLLFIPDENVLSFIDMVNPNEVPFLGFALAHDLPAWRANLVRALTLDWTHLQSGHGNIGSKADIAFAIRYYDDLSAAVTAVTPTVQFGTFMTDSGSVAEAYEKFTREIARQARVQIEDRYNGVHGFDGAVESHAIGLYETSVLY